MKREPVESSLLESVGYDEEQKLLELEFTSGAVYQYEDVPAEVYHELMSADSLGRYFLANIRDFYMYHRVRRPR